MSSERRLLIATHNAGKVREIEALLRDSGWSVEALEPSVPEFFLPMENFLPLRFERSSTLPPLAKSDRTMKCSTFCQSMVTERRCF